jgi:DNA-binding NtrC family response regulator
VPEELASRTHTDVRDPLESRERQPLVLVGVFDGAPTYRVIQARGSVRLGRQGAEVTLRDTKVSRLHAELRRDGASMLLRDLGSRNGTWRNGTQVTSSVALVAGDVVRMGGSLFVCSQWPGPPVPDRDYLAGPLVGGPALDESRRVIDVGARDASAVLVLGETGTGKELVARLVHEKSGRSGKLVPVNCAAIPDTLVESELFGHLRGAFSGSGAGRLGLVREADRGSLFLDEIGELPGPAQAVLLRVLENAEVRPVGADRATHVDLKLIAATHRELREMISAGSFRADLFYRLAVHVVRLPPLSERPEDVVALAHHMLRPESLEASADAFEALLGARFDGNVRGLRNAVNHASAQARADGRRQIELGDLPRLASRLVRPSSADATGRGRATLEAALKDARGNVAKAARSLRIHRSTLYAELLRHGLDSRQFRKRRD